MSEAGRVQGGESASIALKILYTLHGVDSQRYIVKPAVPVAARLFREIELGVVDLQPCLDAIRGVSPDFLQICETHSDDYAVYSTDYAEDGLPLQSHGKVSQQHSIEATGKLCVSRLMREQLELLIHLLPVRKPDELIADFHQKARAEGSTVCGGGGGGGGHAGGGSHAGTATSAGPDASEYACNARKMLPFPLPPASFMSASMLPPLPPQVQIPSSLAAGPVLKSDQILPSSPPVRARPKRINSAMPPNAGHAPMYSMPSNAAGAAAAANSGAHVHASAHASANAGSGAATASGLMARPHGGPASSLSSSSALGAPSGTASMAQLTHSAPKRAASDAPHAAASKKKRALSPKTEGEAQCGNCGVATASTWRRAKCPDGKGELLCNACGLYYRAKKVMRPRFLWDKMRTRGDQDSHAGGAAEAPSSEDTAAGHASSSSAGSASSSTSASATASMYASVSASASAAPAMQAAAAARISPSKYGGEPGECGASPEERQMLWSREQANSFLTSDPADISDRLIDATAQDDSVTQLISMSRSDSIHERPAEQPRSGSEPPREAQIPMPTTPERKSNFAPMEPDSMQKWLGLSTPDQRLGMLMPGSGSARKWLDRAMNPTHFDELWNSPTPRKTRAAVPDLTAFTSSPPTSSSNMLSEVAEWNLVHGSPGTPRALKFFKGSDADLVLDTVDPKSSTAEARAASGARAG